MEPNARTRPLTRPHGLLLDMDGTLTVARLDFPAMKQEMGIGDQPILEALAEMDPQHRARAVEILERHEAEAAQNSDLAPGAGALLDWLVQRALPFAVVTRNSRQCLEVTRAKHSLPECVCISRDDAPFKPDPRPLRLACARLNVETHRAWMAGDGRFDIEAANSAGIFSVWISRGRRERPFEAAPDRTVEDLHALLTLLKAADAGSPGAGPRV